METFNEFEAHGRAKEFVFGILLVLITLVAYYPSLHNQFVWDDDKYVTENAAVKNQDGLTHIWFRLDSPPQYYPLTFTSFWIQHRIWGLQPFSYHLVNLLAHTLGALLLWRLLQRLAVPGALMAAAIFALHPVNVESVAWVTERKNVLSGVFYFASALAYLTFDPPGAGEGENRRRWWWYGAAVVFFALALLSKTVTCSLPAALLLILWWKRPRLTTRQVVPLLPLFAAGVWMGFITSWVERNYVGAENVDLSFAYLERFLLAAGVLGFYFLKLIWPFGISFIYPKWPIGPTDGYSLACIFGVVATVAILWRMQRKWGRGPLVALLFFIGTLFPVLGFFDVYFMRYSFVADHFQYLACIGPIALIVAACEKAVARMGGSDSTRLRMLSPTRMGVCVMLIVALAFLTWKQCHAYENAETLWRDVLAKNPDAWIAHNNLGEILARQNKVDESMAHFRKALELKPDHANAHNNLGIMYAGQGKHEDALKEYESALRIKPDFPEALRGMGNTLLAMGRTEEALIRLRDAVRVNPLFVEGQMDYANMLAARKRFELAELHYRQAMEAAPDRSDVRINFGSALLFEKRIDEAAKLFEEAIQRDPKSAEARTGLGTALAMSGRVEDAVAQFVEALRIDPNSIHAYTNLGHALTQQGRLEQAAEAFRRAVILNPRDPNSLINLGHALEDIGKIKEAAAAYEDVLRIQPNNVDAKNALDALQAKLGK